MILTFSIVKEAWAQTRFIPSDAGTNPAPACLQALETVYEKALSTAMWGVGIASFFGIIIGGVKYMASGADDKALTSARQTITYGIIGLVLAVAAYALLNGLNLIIFRVSSLIKFDIPGTCT
ncbi:hypothetical protein COT49_01675 [candidate division WWE3 bacterium CG08_land_8_20_14_0_20_40_13]|uniref:Uncharacterized protein n=1 Tax=candidate division WWE3 bacterium CG08_land_8_20_14_0_20_40_13 TaxID=1975084 RepID=A0A2H0XDX5_UNCKA|nr:MAG: hypothetical protein COT49_01675 [candidate division WWE3 bacterium CG08_land_8_20_14_0_20_40_13]